MERFSRLLDDLYFTNSTKAKEAIFADYLRGTADPDRGWATAAIAGTLSFDLFKRSLTKQLMIERMDPFLFDISRDYVGELSETVALAWRPSPDARRLNRLPSLSEVIAQFHARDKAGISEYLTELLDNMTPPQRWALLKLGTRGLRVGMSARSVKRTIANMKDVDLDTIEELWHAIKPPYTELFAWIDGKAPIPDVSGLLTYSPVMLAHPIEDKDFSRIAPETHAIEWKFDGIRVQIAANNSETKLFSRKGDDISHSFPDLIAACDFTGVLDGELLVRTGEEIGRFNDLQQRLNKKKPSKSIMEKLPAHFMAYDMLALDGESIKSKSFDVRRQKLEKFMAVRNKTRFSISRILPFDDKSDLDALRQKAAQTGGLIEGLMIKERASPYVAGRPKHAWYKWKRDPFLLDTVLMYAQRGTGKRSSYYSDYTFGVWSEQGQLLPIGKAYFGFTDEELKEIDKWVRNNKKERFGPVQEVKKELVFEIAFDSAHQSPRHKSGYALRFPRINRIRWDKPAVDADTIEMVASIVGK
ncbi:cisplatin damage response ATP-dependent DNA ligase [Parasphingorhabdus sp. JC815]|uniref:cisplatin damage response ATP-dependent DNA ligase n=1 Tax=Parasphingorhabdus sp. JC815 TaxID=3232140 RepID=UPI00345958D6